MSVAETETSAARPNTPGSGDENIAILEPALWRQLGEADGPAARASAWAALAARLIPGARLATVVLSGPAGFAPAALWPAGDSPSDLTMAAVEAALEQRAGAVRFGRVRGPAREAAVALPLLVGRDAVGAAAVSLSGAAEEQLRAAMRLLHWGAGWLRAGAAAPRPADVGTAAILELLGATVEETGFRAAAQRAVTDLALRFGCDRVSLGFRRGAVTRIIAISHSAVVECRGDEAALLAAAMDEAIDQRAAIRFPPTDEDLRQPLARHAHEQLAAACGGGVLTAPLVRGDGIAGALLLEWPPARPLTDEDIARLDLTAALIGAILWERWREERWLIVKAAEAAASQVRMLIGPDHAARKLIALALLLLTIVGATWRGEYRVVAQARLEGSIQRDIVAGMDGFLREAPARAGDRVRKGDVLAVLDDRDLTLERLRWSTERQQRQLELERAIGEQKRAEANIIRAELDQAEAQVALADVMLARTRFVAPFDALVVSGDHNQSIGGAVRRGDVLYDLAPLDDWRVVLGRRRIADRRCRAG